MKRTQYLGILALLILGLAGCATATGEINAGRQAFLNGDHNVALVRFQNAATISPDTLYYSALPEGTWTYLGRGYYINGRYPEAQQTLQRAVARSSDDSLARLYLGLTLARQGDHGRALPEIESGLKGVSDWLDYIEVRFQYSFGVFWDTRKLIRIEIANDLAMIRNGVNWPRLIASSEWVGRQMEEEVLEARWGEHQELHRDSEGKQP